MVTRFVSLKGQPIHKGHCYLIRSMLDEYRQGDDIVIGIVNPYPLDTLDLSRNRKPENFYPSRNPLSYYERTYLLRHYLTSLFVAYDPKIVSSIVITPYFVPTIHSQTLMYNYLDVQINSIEYISDKDQFELGKEEELRQIGISVKFIEALRDKKGQHYSANKIRNDICNQLDTSDAFEPIILRLMESKNLFSTIRERVLERVKLEK
ncbi:MULTISPECIES: hypothetical protein [unclassified Okeania]|uniref:hypothetical protein n=1 Tax=unclassified Okeania TaxID=2634635 RepID=UPI0013F7D70D|nr:MULTISPECIES: hypothetical protein [unclassified Okeania]NET28422.1 hypothetical protein [Okeania sp. SIO1I7]